MITEIIIIVLLILLNGLFSMAEMAVISARKNRLIQKAQTGNKGAVSALELAENPNRFLSTVQIAITLIAILSGAFGGTTLAEKLGIELKKIPALAAYGETISVGLVVIIITYLSIVLGELVPKRLALNNAEKIATAISPLMKIVSKITTPIVSLLSGSTNLVLKILGIKPSEEPEVTEEDLRSMLDQGTEDGVFTESEQVMVEKIFRLGDRNISALMTPRPDIVFLDVDDQHEDIRAKLATYSFSIFPVKKDTTDNIVGIVYARDLLLQQSDGSNLNLLKVLHQPLFIPEATPAHDVLETFRLSGAEFAVVIDEYGGVVGLVSINDILKAIVGYILIPGMEHESEVIRREDGSWLFDGMILADDLKDHLEISELPDESDGSYETLSGLMMKQLGRIPTSGDHFDWLGFHFEVVDMDGKRVDKVLVSKLENGKNIK